jgi:hypothetical protein
MTHIQTHTMPIPACQALHQAVHQRSHGWTICACHQCPRMTFPTCACRHHPRTTFQTCACHHCPRTTHMMIMMIIFTLYNCPIASCRHCPRKTHIQTHIQTHTEPIPACHLVRQPLDNSPHRWTIRTCLHGTSRTWTCHQYLGNKIMTRKCRHGTRPTRTCHQCLGQHAQTCQCHHCPTWTCHQCLGRSRVLKRAN